MSCPACGAETVAFAVPEDLRPHAPGEYAAVCTRCLRVHPAESGAADPDFSPVADAFPDGRAGVALALLCGKLDSLALQRSSIERLAEAAERAGADVWLALDRLGSADVDPHFDRERRLAQLDDLL